MSGATKKFKLLSTFVLTLLFFCTATKAKSDATGGINKTHQRIVSLAPSNTELLYALSAEQKLVGVSQFCNYPIQAKSKPIAGTMNSCNIEKLLFMKPDLILLVKGQERLAKTIEKNYEHLHQNKKPQIRIFCNDKLEDICTNILQLGKLSNQEGYSKNLAHRFKSCLDELAKIQANNKPKVFYCVWPQPLMTAGSGSFIDSAISLCGGDNIASTINKNYPYYNLESLAIKDPDIIIMPNSQKATNFLTKSPWKNMKAVRKNQVYFLPPPEENFLERPTPRVIHGLYWLACKIQPQNESQLRHWYKLWSSDFDLEKSKQTKPRLTTLK